MMSDYRPVKRSASGEGNYVWVLLNLRTGDLLRSGKAVRIFDNKGVATRTGEEVTSRRLYPDILTPKQVAKAARRTAEAAERDKAFVPHVAAAKAATRGAIGDALVDMQAADIYDALQDKPRLMAAAQRQVASVRSAGEQQVATVRTAAERGTVTTKPTTQPARTKRKARGG